MLRLHRFAVPAGPGRNSFAPGSLALAIGLLLTAGVLTAKAEEEDASASTSGESRRAIDLDAVKVRAERIRNRNGALGDRPVLDTPFSISTVDSSQIESRQIASLNQMFFSDASVAAAGSTYGMWATSPPTTATCRTEKSAIRGWSWRATCIRLK
ncbi:MAG: hypothetical protein QM601_05020 [Pseudoxanthomonas sp.]